MYDRRTRALAIALVLSGCGEARRPSPEAPITIATASSPTTERTPLPRCTASPPDVCSADGWCVDHPRPTSTMLRSIWGSGPSDIYAVGNLGAILHFDGERWSSRVSDPGTIFLDVWGSGSDDVYAVTHGSVLTHFDGKTWSTVETPFSALEAIWGSSKSDVWAAGSEGHVVHFDGSKWARVDAGVKTDITAIWGTGPNDVYAAARAAIHHFDGKRWRVAKKGQYDEIVYAIGGSGPQDVYASWGSGSVLHFDGKTWTEERHPGGIIADIWARSADEIYAVAGSRILKRSGGSWAFEPDAMPAIDSYGMTNLDGVWGTPTGEVFAVGWDGAILQKGPSGWSAGSTLTLRTLVAAWGSSSNDIYAGGNGTLLHSDGCTWRELPAEMTSIEAIWGSGPTDVFVVGTEGSIRHFDGTTWSKMATGIDTSLLGIWGRGPADVYAVGVDGVVLHFDGRAWSQLPAPETIDLRSVAGSGTRSVIVSSGDGRMFEWDGSKWTPRPLQRLGTGVFPVGKEALFLERGGGVRRDLPEGWTPLGEGDLAGTFAAMGTSLSDIFTAGVYGRIQHFDGSTWTTQSQMTEHSLRGVWANDAVAIAVGDDGVILRKNRRAQSRQ